MKNQLVVFFEPVRKTRRADPGGYSLIHDALEALKLEKDLNYVIKNYRDNYLEYKNSRILVSNWAKGFFNNFNEKIFLDSLALSKD